MMACNKKMVASVKCGGKVMREHGDTVYLPYGNEYSVLLKNLSSQRALVNIEIDGQNVVPGGLIVNSNQSIDLERFVLNNDLSQGPRFKFIEKTERISDTRGDRVDDGIIRISYKYEYAFNNQLNTNYWLKTSHLYDTRVGGTVYGSGINSLLGSCDNMVYSASVSKGPVGIRGMEGPRGDVGNNDAGITTYGSESNQKFTTGNIGLLETEEHVIVLQLKGDIGQVPVLKPITVDTKILCKTCGKSNRSLPQAKFCSECGTNLSY
jgi:hypothetical protein